MVHSIPFACCILLYLVDFIHLRHWRLARRFWGGRPSISALGRGTFVYGHMGVYHPAEDDPERETTAAFEGAILRVHSRRVFRSVEDGSTPSSAPVRWNIDQTPLVGIFGQIHIQEFNGQFSIRLLEPSREEPFS